MHGDETTGPAAARLLAAGRAPSRGMLLVLPEASPEALAAGTRTAPGHGDLNRAFPGSPEGDSAQRRAAAIFRLIEREKPDLVLDLHESDEYWDEGDGPVLVIPPLVSAAEIALSMLERPDMADFGYTGNPPAGSLAAEAARLLGIPVLIVEVPDRLAPQERITVFLRTVEAAQAALGM